jgi:PAS domain-containing protein
MPNKRILYDSDGVTPLLKRYSTDLNPEFVMKDRVKEFKDFKQFLEYFSHHDECYTHFDMKTLTVQWSYGFTRWLGYDSKEIEGAGYDHMKMLVHPFITSWYTAFLKSMYLVFVENTKLTDLKPRFVINIPVQHKDGRYLLVKQMSMPYGINENGKVFGFINSYSIFGDYQAEPLSPQVFGENGKPDPVEMEKVREYMYTCITRDTTNWYLTDTQVKIIRKIRALRKKGIKATNAHMVEVNRKKESVSTTMLRIKELLLDMLDEKVLLEGEDKTPGLPNSKDYFELIEYFDLSGILDITIQYAKKYYVKKPI